MIFFVFLGNALKKTYFIFLKFYRLFLSPVFSILGAQCRFYPTCSHYSEEAVKEWGLVRGIALSLWRIIRCQPFCKGGRDPVPKQKKNMGF